MHIVAIALYEIIIILGLNFIFNIFILNYFY